MNHDLRNHSPARRLLSLVLIAQLALATPLHAASVALASTPLVNATSSLTVSPNLMFIMDNSGSMSQEYTPDWISEYELREAPWTYDWDGSGGGRWNAPATNQKNCRDSADDQGTIETGLANMDMCVVGDVPFMNSAINSQYYNPEIRYLPGANADGSSKPSQTDPTRVLLDGYNKHLKTQLGAAGTGTPPTINLTTEYPDRVWCTTDNPAAGDITGATAATANCRTNTDYLYPDATYKYGRDADGTVANKNVLGKYGAPYYYKTVVSEYCLEAELRNCVTAGAATGLYIFPAKARYCSDTALTTCQSIKTSTYKYPRYPGASTTAVAATGGKFRVGSSSPRTITSVTFGPSSIEILGTPVVAAASRVALATLVAANITAHASNPDFIASVCSTDYVCLTSTAAAGASGNGSFSVTGSAGSSNFTASSGGVTGSAPAAYTFARTDITAPVAPDVGSYPKSTSRTDCAGATCTYAEEITNFANWYAYYRTRMQSMKSSVSNAFLPIGSNYRVGFVNICATNNDYLAVAPFVNAGAVAAAGTIQIERSIDRSLSSLKVNNIEILGGTVSWGSAGDRPAFAALIAAQINAYSSSPEYTATADDRVITITSTKDAGATGNGDITFTSTVGLNNGDMLIPLLASPHIRGGISGTTGQKTDWYSKLLNTTASGCGTPLRYALGRVGRMYAGLELSTKGETSGADIDPVQYSCQKNFALLTTDGYWNGSGGTDLAGVAMGNKDNNSVDRSIGVYEGPTASTGSLADVAKYYYDSDLRNSAAPTNNCTGGRGTNVCQESATSFTQQRMITYTLGLGVDGTLPYISDYATASSGAFYDLKNGLNSTNWPVPVADSETAVDDLWHAAVNGGGTYYSAKDPAQLGAGLNAALAAINSEVGAASAAATSTLNPVAGNNFAYVASYTTGQWKGNLEARTINVDTGVVSETATWCVESIVQGTCSSPKAKVVSFVGSSTVTNCVESGTTLAACPSPGVFDSVAGTCAVEMTNSCTGTMPSKVAASTDTRTIYKRKSDGTLEDFTYANLNAANFSATGLSQWSVLTTAQKTAAAGENLVNFLRGRTGFEDRTSNTATNRLYRMREATLGDALESQPFFISKPVFSYADPGYSTYKTAQASRAGTVFMGANDGMMHAFAADTGSERWAYVPSAVIPNMWKLADKNYATSHTNYVNGSPVISDICTANCTCDTACVAGGGTAPTWKTILVGGLNAGGRSYYALDITDPATPTMLWEHSSSDTGFSNLGFSFGQPIITKKADGTWVVVITSGYNNTSPGTGKGSLFVLNASDGTKISEYDTGAGDTTTPSGLAKVAAWNEFQGTDNTAGYLYGGDLLGNVWRFDINTADSVAPLLFATLKDSSGNAQPVTTVPALGEIDSYRVVFVGTGKYLEVKDLTYPHPDAPSDQSIYAIKDDNTATTLVDARSALVAQTMNMTSAAATSRTASNNSVNFASGRGWYVDLGAIIAPGTTPTFVGERVNIDMQLVQGTLIAATIVPANTDCSPGGEGWLNFFKYDTGGYVGPLTTVSARYTSPIVGINVIYISGSPVVEVVTSKKPTPEIDPNVQISNSAAGFSAKRVIWRELVP
jgi:type IV pilus assembly protein PilY1